jgi:hypothetical protein
MLKQRLPQDDDLLRDVSLFVFPSNMRLQYFREGIPRSSVLAANFCFCFARGCKASHAKGLAGFNFIM